ncbi:MAG: toprim domain-containing protein [bacterium]
MALEEIKDMEMSFDQLRRIKELNLPEIIKSYGIPEGTKANGTPNGTYSFKCPFHDDYNPSLKVNQKGNKWLWHCFGCGAGGNTISFVTKYEKISWLGAYRKLLALTDKKNQDQELTQEPIVDFSPADLLKRVTDFYHETFKEDRRALEYLAKRKITDQNIYMDFKLGFANGSLKKTLPPDGPMIEVLKASGILNAKGNEAFYNCVIFPIEDEYGNVVSLYGRNIERNSHLYLAGQHRGVFNSKVLASADKIYLTESIIDSLSLYQLGIKETIPLYGINGLTRGHLELIQKHRIKEIVLCLDNDTAGERAAERISITLKELGIKTATIRLPEGVKDPNEYLLTGITQQDFTRLIAAQAQEAGPTAGLAARPAASPAADKAQENYPLVTEDETQITFNFKDHAYRIRGLNWNRLDQLKVNIKLTSLENYHLDTLDLYSAKHRQIFIAQAGKVISLEPSILNADLSLIVERLENIQAKKLEKNENKEQKPVMTEQERQNALEYLKAPDLLDKIVADFKIYGYIGEQNNVLLGYLAAVSRKLSDPLAILTVSRSAAGKSALQDAILSFTPEEDYEKYTRLTDQALFYKGETSLVHKLLAIEEEHGANGARYSLRNLQSARSLRTASTIKDPVTGKLKTDVYTVKGPTAIMITTTYNENFDYETYNRFIILTIDESIEQTRLILEKQRQNQSIKGIILKREKEEIRTKHHSIQRLLRTLEVVNPYSEQLSFTDAVLRARREQPKYLSLIKTIALLRQYQKEIKTGYAGDDSFEYIEVDLKDIEAANEIANQILGHSLSEMSPPSRLLLIEIKKLVDKIREEENLLPEKCIISRRDIREWTRWSEYQIRTHITELEDLEYLIPVSGKQGKRFTYILAWDGQGSDGEKFILGLKDIEKLDHSASL